MTSCTNSNKPESKASLADEVKTEFIRSWEAYKTYAWGHDVLLPLSRSYQNWYKESLHISPIDAYSTMKLMGLDSYASEIEQYVTDSISWGKNLFVKTFEVNIRILGGLTAFSSIEDVRTMKKKDYMPTFFFAETLKYLYLAFSMEDSEFSLDDYIFNTEAHPFKKESFTEAEISSRLGF